MRFESVLGEATEEGDVKRLDTSVGLVHCRENIHICGKRESHGFAVVPQEFELLRRRLALSIRSEAFVRL